MFINTILEFQLILIINNEFIANNSLSKERLTKRKSLSVCVSSYVWSRIYLLYYDC